MPNLAKLIENGVMGDLAPLTPLCPPLLWTSIATGQLADRHGVLDTVEPDPVTGGLRPVTRASLAAPQVWDLLARHGIASHVVGWPATHPAQGPSTCISDGFPLGVPRSLYPHSLAAAVEPLRFQPQEWSGSELSLFVPQLASIDQQKDRRLAALAASLAQAVSIHAAATTLMSSASWEFSAVWFGVIGAVSSLIPPDRDHAYLDVLPGVYRFLDLLLGRLLHLAGPEAVALLVSDRAAGEPEWQDATGVGSRGILCASGPHIENDELAFGAGPLDLAPTILALFGFQSAELPGRILSEICPDVPTKSISVGANAAPAPSLQSLLDRDRLELEALGYKDAAAEAHRPEVEAAEARRNFHLARVLLAQDRAAEAVPLLEKIAAAFPRNREYRLYLGHAYLQNGNVAECRILSEALLAENPDSPFAAISRTYLALMEGRHREAREHLKGGRGVYGVDAALDVAMGVAALKAGDHGQAADAFRSAIASGTRMPAAHTGLARAMLLSKRYEEAADAALDAVRLRYDIPEAHEILGLALRAMGREQDAAGAFAARDHLLRRHGPAA
jgi:tetratricopeptide (TPR) repeat protein